VGLVSTSLLFFMPGTVAAMFANAQDVRLLQVSTHGIRLFCFAYVFRWFVVVTQGFLSAIEKPKLAAIMSLGTAFVFPVALLGILWPFGLDGIWFNFVGVNALSAVVGTVMLRRVKKEIRLREKQKAIV